MTASLSLYKGTPIAVELPAAVELEVTYAEPGVKGDTRTGATKSVTLQTGIKIQVPLFVEQGDRVKVDTRSGEYLTRV
jgi:elongation factor P